MNLQHFTRFFEIHQWIFAKHVEGVTHEESCRTPPGGGNSLNWVLGHIVASRNDILKLLGEPPCWSEDEAAPYLRGSAGMSDPAAARPLPEIADALERSHAAIHSKLEKMSADDLAKPTAKGTVGADLAFFQFHESYHAGQIGLLRRSLGKEGVIR
jgi:uncharacterized damage-inducible protein DinB